MKILVPSRPQSRGSAVVIVLALLFLMAAFLAANDAMLRNLHQELQLIERRQQIHWQPSTATHRPPRARQTARPATADAVRPETASPSTAVRL